MTTEIATWIALLLFQYLWQGLLIAGGLAVTLALARRATAATRHALCALALLALVALPTTAWLPFRHGTPAALENAARGVHPVETPAQADRPLPAASGDAAPDGAAAAPRGPGVFTALGARARRVALVGRIAGARLATAVARTVALAWLAGAVVLLGRLAIRVVRAERLRRHATPRTDASPREHDGGPEVRVSPAVTSPLVVGLLRPTIVLPAGLARRCSRADLARVIAHEHAHVIRRDVRWHLFQCAVEACLFFHPGVRWIARRMEFEREAACDDWAAARTGGATAYSASLLTVCESVRRAPRLLAVGALASQSQLTRRIDTMLNHERDHRPESSAVTVAAFAAVCTALIAVLGLAAPAPAWAAPDVAAARDGDRGLDPMHRGDRRGATPLIRAAQDGDAATVRRLLDAGADPNESARHEPRSPLYAAAFAGDVATLRVLLDAGAVVDRVVPGDETPLMAACRRGHFAAARLLVDHGADVDRALRGDGTPLINAAAGGNPDVVRLLLDAGADVDRAVRGDGNPLLVATRRGHADVVRLLLAAGATPDASVRGDGNALINAARSGDAATVDALLAAGADPDRAVRGDGNALIVAAARGNTDAVDRLLAAGADPDAAVRGDGNALIVAAARGNTATVDRLLAAGADPDAAVRGDGSPLINAARSGELATVRALVDAGADVDMPVTGDGNPLIAAAASGHVEIAGYLIDRGADVDRVVPGDETPLINAAARGHLDVARLLLEAGADPDLAVRVRAWDGGRGRETVRSPLGEAERHGHAAIVRLLREYGARD